MLLAMYLKAGWLGSLPSVLVVVASMSDFRMVCWMSSALGIDGQWSNGMKRKESEVRQALWVCIQMTGS